VFAGATKQLQISIALAKLLAPKTYLLPSSKRAAWAAEVWGWGRSEDSRCGGLRGIAGEMRVRDGRADKGLCNF